ncbi:MAG: helix-turn-helix transcriptional regulator, partial [Kofleriaceae bacterium]|nr:helix-turn-helix transcriptional regulator [Kofleriaceae bacterium]
EQELHKIIGLKLRTLRKQRNLTLKQMARRTELSVSLISQLERAEATVSIASLYKLACALDVRITDFFVNF